MANRRWQGRIWVLGHEEPLLHLGRNAVGRLPLEDRKAAAALEYVLVGEGGIRLAAVRRRDGDGGLLEIGEGGALEEGLLVSALFVPEDVGERHLEYGRHGCALRVLAAMRADDNMLDVDIELALRI